MVATFNGNPRATIISCYSPTNVSEENEIVTFYDELSSLVRSIPKHNMLVIGGDMNAQIGKNGNNKYSLHNTSNRNGQHLTDFMIENRLACLNTNYQKREGKLWTYTYANNTKAQIDYVLINKKWKNSALNCEAYSSFEGVSTDHRIVTAKIRLSLRKNDKRTATTKHYDWALLNNKDVRDKYVLELRNRFETLQEKTEKSTPNDEYENFVNAHLEAAAKCIPTKIKTKYRVPWETLAVREKRALVKTASKNYRKNPTNTNALKLKTAQYQLAGIYIKEQTEYIQNQIDKIRDSVEDRQSRIAWQTINEVSRRKNTTKAKLKAANQQERIKLWKQHFENLLGNPPKITHEPITRIISKQLDIKLGPFTQGELDSVLRKIKNRKAAGLDEIPPEVWKTRQFDDILLRHCNAVYNQNPIDRWTKGCILPFPKKGDLGLAKNYRGITLTSIAAKIYNALLRNRIEPKIDNILRKNQNGFRRNRSTTSQILTIRRILEGVRAKNLQATLIFVDFTKAFDSIHRGKMEQILLAYGIPKETVAAITILYRNTKVKVRSPDGDTEYFDIVAGVLQGDTLAPYLFIICLDYVLRTSIDKIKENGFELTKKRSRRYPATTITDADYADDIAILANTPDQAETLLHSLERAAASIGLHVNAHKTEYMCYNQTGDISTLEGTPLKLVDKFTYLGSSVESTEKDIETRLTKAWTAINRLSTIWKSDLTDKMKRSFFQAAVTSILLYGCTTWTLTKRLEKKLDGNYTRMLRAILNKSWQQHPTRHQLYGHLPPITKSIQVRRTRHAGHCWRSRDELISDVLLWIPTHGRAKAGRPARTYIQQLCEDTGCCPEDLPRAMNDREEWRERVRDIRAASTIWWWWWWWRSTCDIVLCLGKKALFSSSFVVVFLAISFFKRTDNAIWYSLLMVLPFSKKSMNKIPYASQNMVPKTLPADVCVFGHLGRLSPAAVHSADCQFDSRVKRWIHVSSIVTYLRKNSFCCVETVTNNALNRQYVVVFINCEQTQHLLWTQLSQEQMFIQNGEYAAYWYLQLLCYLKQLQFTIGQNEFVEFFGVFRDNCHIWATWTFSIICVCTTAFTVSIPPLNYFFRQSRVRITLIKPLLRLNSIFSNQKAMLYQNTKFSFCPCCENLKQ